MKANSLGRSLFLGLLILLAPGVASAVDDATPEAVEPLDLTVLAKPYEDAYTGSVLPVPMRMQFNEGSHVLCNLETGRSMACVVLSPNASDMERLAARQLSIQPSYLADPKAYFAGQSSVPPLPVMDVGDATGAFDTVIVLGVDSVPGLSAEDVIAIDTIKSSTEGYVIRKVANAGQTTVLCYGPNPVGNFYAVQTLRQLITTEGQAVVLKDFLVGDWPHFPLRGVIHEGAYGYESLQVIDRLAAYKLNMFCFGGWLPDWRRPDEKYMEFVREACGKCKALGAVTANFMVRPYKGSTKLDITISDKDDVERLVDLFKFAIDSGAGAVTLRADDIYSFKPSDEKQFKTLPAAHAYLANKVYEELIRVKPDLAFFFMSPFYEGRGVGGAVKRPEIESYLNALGQNLRPEIQVLWTGPTTRSLWISEQDLEGYSTVLGRTPVLWDNTLYAHKGQYVYDLKHPSYLFDPFATKYPKTFLSQATGALFNGGDSEVYRVGRLNVADILWNPSAYDPKQSLRTALTKVSGNTSDGSDYLLEVRRLYYDIHDVRYSGMRLTRAGRAKVLKSHDELLQISEYLDDTVKNDQMRRKINNRLDENDEFSESVEQVETEFEAIADNIIGKVPMQARAWVDSSTGGWGIKFPGEFITMSNRANAHSPKGSKAEVSTRIKVPQSETERYYLLISAGDDYSVGEKSPVYKQVFIDDELVWERSISGDDSLAEESLNLADVTSMLSDKQEVVLTLRTIDTKGVISLWANVSWGDIYLLSSPFPSDLTGRSMSVANASGPVDSVASAMTEAQADSEIAQSGQDTDSQQSTNEKPEISKPVPPKQPGEVAESKKKDTEPPKSKIVTTPSVLETNEVSLEWTGTDNESQPDKLTYAYRLDDAAWTAFTKETSKKFQGLTDGEHTFQVLSIDAEKNKETEPAKLTFKVMMPPETSFDVAPPKSAPSTGVKVSWKGSDNSTKPENLKFQYQIDDDPWSEPAPQTEVEIGALTEGEHKVAVRAIDEIGAVDPSPVEATFAVDVVAPKTIGAKAGSYKRGAPILPIVVNASDNVSATSELQYSIKLGDAVWRPFTKSPNLPAFDLADGEHQISVRTKDEAGNIEEPPFVTTINVAIPPRIEIAKPQKPIPPGPLRLLLSLRDNDTPKEEIKVRYRIDDQEWQQAPPGEVLDLVVPQLSEGPHRFELEATDATGLTDSTSTKFEFTAESPDVQDATAGEPIVSNVAGSPSDTTREAGETAFAAASIGPDDGEASTPGSERYAEILKKYWPIAAAAVVALILAFMIIRRRSKAA